MSGAKVEVVTDALPAGDKRLPILIRELAAKGLGGPQKKYPAYRTVSVSEQVGQARENPRPCFSSASALQLRTEFDRFYP
jgi:hypothetical protein